MASNSSNELVHVTITDGSSGFTMTLGLDKDAVQAVCDQIKVDYPDATIEQAIEIREHLIEHAGMNKYAAQAIVQHYYSQD